MFTVPIVFTMWLKRAVCHNILHIPTTLRDWSIQILSSDITESHKFGYPLGTFFGNILVPSLAIYQLFGICLHLEPTQTTDEAENTNNIVSGNASDGKLLHLNLLAYYTFLKQNLLRQTLGTKMRHCVTVAPKRRRAVFRPCIRLIPDFMSISITTAGISINVAL